MESLSGRAEVRTSPLGRAVYAAAPIGAGEMVLALPPVFDDAPGRHTIQISERRHQAFTGDVDDFLNHSCAPTCRVDAAGLRVVALVPLGVGQELTFNYLTTEWDLTEPFVCSCEGQRRVIRGFGHLAPEEQTGLVPLLTPWLRERVGERISG
jgi:SET domain